MTLAEQDHRYGIPPHAYRPDGNDPNRGPTLPSMSALLNPQPPPTDYYPQAQNPPVARQFGPPYNMNRESAWRSQLEGPATPQAPHQYRTPPVPSASYFSQSPTEPVLLSQQQYPQQHDFAVPAQYGQPLVQRRQLKKITERRGGLSKDGGAHHSARRRPSPLHSRPFEHDANYSPRKDASAHARPALPPPSPSDSSVPRPSMPKQSSRPLPVSGLLSEAPRSRIMPIGPTYRIRMRQQPIAARACGFGERDRRVIDPPPILQMDVTDPNASPAELAALTRQQYTVVHCTLWDPVNDCDDTTMPIATDKRQQRRLMGTLVSSPFVGKDEFNVEGCFFTFPDLSVRTPGTYSLRFQLVILDPEKMGAGASSPVRSIVRSAPFNVFNAKDFRGMRASTALTKVLKLQGCLISVKKGNNKIETLDDEGSVVDGGENDGSEGKKNKRSKR